MKIEDIKQNWGMFLCLGIALFVLGIIALAAALIVGMAAVILFGILLLIAGFLQCAEAVFSRRFSGFLLYLLSGTLYFFVGLIMIIDPQVGGMGLALIIAILFLVGGSFRIGLALQTRYFPDWAWRLFSGILGILLGLVILIRWEESLIIIGLLIAIDLLFTGWTIIMLALTARNIPSRFDEQIPL